MSQRLWLSFNGFPFGFIYSRRQVFVAVGVLMDLHTAHAINDKKIFAIAKIHFDFFIRSDTDTIIT